MKTFIAISIVIISTCLSAAAQTLPDKAASFLRRSYPQWEIVKFRKVEYQENKSTTSGDFNGDGLTDHAVVITKDDRIYTIVLMANKRSFKAFNLLAQKEEDRWIAGLGTAEKNEDVCTERDGVPSIKLKNDGIYVYDFEGVGTVFYWESGIFKTALSC